MPDGLVLGVLSIYSVSRTVFALLGLNIYNRLPRRFGPIDMLSSAYLSPLTVIFCIGHLRSFPYWNAHSWTALRHPKVRLLFHANCRARC